jgi:two-component sensor histidine kinase
LGINAYDNGIFTGYILAHWAGGADIKVPKSRIILYSSKGKFIRDRLYSDFGFSRPIQLFVIRHDKTDKIYLLEDKFLELNDKFEVIRTINLPFHSKIVPFLSDINNDGEDEFLLYSKDEEKLVVYSAGLRKYAELKLKTPDSQWKLSHYFSKDHVHKLYLDSGDMGYFLQLNENRNYYFSYLSYPGIYFLFFFFILIIRKITTYQVVQRESLKQRLLTLQLQGIKNQLDPHFTFNTLNSIASIFYFKNRNTAYDYLNKFTKLLRSMLNDAEKMYRSLEEELNFVTIYLVLEKLRFGEKFNYEIEIGKEINLNLQVPKLVLYTFTENAVKHGIIPREEGGIVKIFVNKEVDYLKLTIEDNGIGRAQSAGHSTSTGKGLKITSEFYDILNQLNKRPIRYTIIDLFNEVHAPSGTRVEVWVPLEEL